MATKKFKNPLDDLEMKVEKGSKITPEKQTLKILKAQIQKERQRANARIRYLEKTGKAQQSYIYREIEGKKFEGVRGKTPEQLKALQKQITGFLQTKTSTIGGMKEVEKAKEKYLKEKDFTFKSKAEEKRFWDLFNKYSDRAKQLQNIDPKAVKYNSSQVQDTIYREYKNTKNKSKIKRREFYKRIEDEIASMESKTIEKENISPFKPMEEDKKKKESRTRNTRSR